MLGMIVELCWSDQRRKIPYNKRYRIEGVDQSAYPTIDREERRAAPFPAKKYKLVTVVGYANVLDYTASIVFPRFVIKY